MLDANNKENYNPVLKMYSPKRLVNQKRYRILRELTQRPSAADPRPSERVAACDERDDVCAGEIEFEDETVRRFGL